MNLPNKLTLMRIVMIPFYVLFMFLSFYYVDALKWVALAIFVAACLTDFFDGKIARKYNLVTDFGKFMDPLADKMLVISALVCFVAFWRIDAWIVIVIIAREFIISGFRLIAAEKGLVIAASWWGKVKTFVTMVMIIVMIPAFGGTFMYVLEQILIYASLVLTVLSLLDYMAKNSSVLSTK